MTYETLVSILDNTFNFEHAVDTLKYHLYYGDEPQLFDVWYRNLKWLIDEHPVEYKHLTPNND